MTTSVNCPTCGKPVSWNTDSPWRPFCCERCKLIDFGDWANESNLIAGEPHFADSDDYEQHSLDKDS